MKAHETVRWHGLQIAEAVGLLDTDLDKGLSYSSPLDADSWLRLIAVAFGVSMIVAFEKRLRARAEADRGSDDTLEPAAHRI
jgi:hypothetical protein